MCESDLVVMDGHESGVLGELQVAGNPFGIIDCLRDPGPGMALAYNIRQTRQWDDIRAFLAVHYKFNTRVDTPFWRACLNETDVADACRSGKLGGYGGDVLDHEPIQPPHPFMEIDNVLITPHVGSRTFESVERQAMRATLNIVNFLKGDKDFIQANKF